MRYAVFIWTKWDTDDDVSPEMFDRYAEFGRAATEAGGLVDGSALHPVSAATTVRLRDDEGLVTDGRFVESKEQLSGYYVFECVDLDDAIAWAARIPGARDGAVDIRPLLVMS